MYQFVSGSVGRKTFITLCVAVIAGTCQLSQAATACVSAAAASGCLTTIGAAITNAAAGDTIQVSAGTYKEAVIINKPLSLVGAGSATTIIDATGVPNGILVDGSAGSLSGVTISGFTVENANFQGIMVQNASSVTIWNNQVIGNDKNLNLTANPVTCTGIAAALVSGEGEDCGEGINLTGSDHSVVANNVVQNNSGGILISDDLGAVHDNVISGNLVSNNPYDCGITLASHSGKGVYHNTVSGNQSLNNGLKQPGGGAGIGMFAPGPGSKTYGNIIINNTVMGNGHPGITMHNHAVVKGAPPISLDDNMIIGNVISGNGADTNDASTPGTTGINIYSVGPVNGIIVSQNVVSGESIGMAFNAPGAARAFLNNFMSIGVVNLGGGGTVDASQNWWGCAGGPNTAGCGAASNSGVVSPAWLTSPFTSTSLPGAVTPVTPPGGGGGGSTVTIAITGPGGTTSTSNNFSTVSNQIALNASMSTSTSQGTLTYSWTPSPGFPIVGIVGGNTATPSFQLSQLGTYQFTLTVTDGTGAKATATVTAQYL